MCRSIVDRTDGSMEGGEGRRLDGWVHKWIEGYIDKWKYGYLLEQNMYDRGYIMGGKTKGWSGQRGKWRNGLSKILGKKSYRGRHKGVMGQTLERWI